MKLESFLQAVIFLLVVSLLVATFGDKVGDPVCRSMGRTVGGALFVGVALFLIITIIRLAWKGERALIFDVVNHVILDPETKEIMFDMDSDGTIRDHETGEVLCTFDGDTKTCHASDGKPVDFHQLDLTWRRKNTTIKTEIQAEPKDT